MAGWAACKGTTPVGPVEPSLRRLPDGSVVIGNVGGQEVRVRHHDLPRLATMLAREWWKGVDDTPLDTKAADRVSSAWDGGPS